MTSNKPAGPVGKIGIVCGGDPRAEGSHEAAFERFRNVIEALAKRAIATEVVVYSDDVIEDVRHRLLQLDGALVWVNPIMHDGRDRSRLDALLREVASQGVWVSTHPDVILKMGTKEVLVRTKELGWGTDTYVYRTMGELREHLPDRLKTGTARVLKQNRGNGGNGVWKIELAPGTPGSAAGTEVHADTLVRVLHALRGSTEEQLRLGDFMDRCEEYFARSGCVVDQPFQPRLAAGMIRCYLVQDKVVGFGHQFIKALTPPPPPEAGPEAAEGPPRLYYGPEKPEFQALKGILETEWVPQMQRVLGIETGSLPLLWDADFLYGPKTESGDDTYILCEINVSSVHPFPEEAAEPLAEATVARVQLVGRRLGS